MLRISPSQEDSLHSASDARYRREFGNWLYDVRAEIGCPDATRQDAMTCAEKSIDDCLRFGISADLDMRRFAMRALRWGNGFYDREDKAYAGAVLRSDTVAPHLKITRLQEIEMGLKAPPQTNGTVR